MIISAINNAKQCNNFTGVRKIVSNGADIKIGDFLIKSVREITTKDGIERVVTFSTPSGKKIGYHAVGKNGNMIGERIFSNGTQVQYWTNTLPQMKKTDPIKKILSVFIRTSRATNKKPANTYTAVFPEDMISKNPKIITTKNGLLNAVIEKNKKDLADFKKLIRNSKFTNVTENIF